MKSGNRRQRPPARRSGRQRPAAVSGTGRGHLPHPAIQPAGVGLAEALEALQPHDHLCLIHESEAEWRAAAIPFIAIGLRRGEKCLYVVDARTADEVRRCLQEEGIDVGRAERDGQLSILHEAEAYTREGYFDPDRMIALLVEETEKAVAAGYPALRVTGEMTWILRGHPGSEKVLEYEAKLNRDLFPAHPCLAICQYDRWRFDPEIIKGVVKTHPLLVRGNRVYRNSYYIPPGEFLSDKNADVEVQHWLNSLERHVEGEKQLLDAAATLQAYFQHALAPIMVVDEDGRYVDANRAALGFLECSREELLGKTVWDFTPPALLEQQKKGHAPFYGPRMLETEYLVGDRIMTLLLNVVPVEAGGRRLLYGMGLDITERKQAEEELRRRARHIEALYSVSTAMGQSLELDVMLDIALERAVNALNAMGGYIHIFDADSKMAVLKAHHGISDDYRRAVERVHVTDEAIERWKKYPGPAFRTSKILDQSSYTGARQAGDREGAVPQGFVTVPLWWKDEMYGGLSLTHGRPHRYSDEELELLQAIANEIAAGMANARLYERVTAAARAMEEERRRAQAYFDSAAVMMVVLDPQGKVIEVNRKTCQVLGYGESDIVGRDWHLSFLPGPLGTRARELHLALCAGEIEPPESFENPILARDGSQRDVLWHAAVLRDADGTIVAGLACGEDITERKRAEHGLRLSERHLTDLVELHKMADSTGKSIMDFALDASLRSLQSQFAFIGMMSSDEAVMTIDAWSGGAMEQCAVTERPVQFAVAGAGLWGEAVRQRRPIVVNDYETTDRYKKGYPTGHVPIRRFLGIPLFWGGRIVAVAAVANKATDYDEADVHAFTTLLDEMWNLIERRRANEQLRASEEKYRTLVDDIGDGYLVARGSKVLFANKVITDALGISREELTGAVFLQQLTPESREVSRRIYEQTRRGEPPPDMVQVELVGAGGRRFPAELRLKEITYEGRRAYAIMVRDITERRRAEEALRQSEEKFRGAFHSSPLPMAITRADDGRYIEVNDAWVRANGYTREEAVGRTSLELGLWMSDEDRAHMVEALRRDGIVRDMVIEMGTGSGERRITQFSAELLKAGDETWIISIGEDITERKQAEEALRESERRLRSLASQLSLAEERERRRLAEGIHDLVGQPLAVAKMKLGALRQSLSSPDLTRNADEVLAAIEEAMRETRAMTFELSPPVLYQLGLEKALEWLADQMKTRHGIACSFEDDGHPKPLGDDARGLLFRFASEMLMNAVKHSRAKHVKVSIWRDGDRAKIRVEDDGVGFDASEVERSTGRFGLFSIRQRLAEMGGEMFVDSAPGSGTRVTVAAPLQADD